MLTTQHIKLPLSDTRPQTHAVAHLPVNQHWTVLKGFQNKKRLQLKPAAEFPIYM
jgi:hypothetical protein